MDHEKIGFQLDVSTSKDYRREMVGGTKITKEDKDAAILAIQSVIPGLGLDTELTIPRLTIVAEKKDFETGSTVTMSEGTINKIFTSIQKATRAGVSVSIFYPDDNKVTKETVSTQN